MYQVFINGTDRTNKVSWDGIRIFEQLGGQSNTATVSLENFVPTEGEDIEIYDGVSTLAATTGAGSKTFTFADDQSIISRFRVGDTVVLGPTLSVEEPVVLTAVTSTSVTAVETQSHAAGTLVGRKVFGGTITKVACENPEQNTSYLVVTLECVEYAKKMNRKLWNDTYTEKTVRWILIDGIQKFVNVSAEVDGFEYADAAALQAVWIETGTGTNPTRSTADYQEGSIAASFGWTGSGTATFTATTTSVDASLLTGATSGAVTKGYLSCWIKFSDYTTITTVTLRVGSASSHNIFLALSFNPYELQATNEWQQLYIPLTSMTLLGTPDWTALDYARVTVAETGTSSLLIDGLRIMADNSFTFKHITLSTPTMDDVRFSFKPPTAVIDALASTISWKWYLDYDQDLHFFESNDTPAPFTLTDTSYNFGSVRVTPDVSQLVNTVYVRGGTEASSTQTDIYLANGTDTIFTIKESPRTIGVNDNDEAIYDFTLDVNTGGGYTSRTVGIIGVDDPASFQWMMNPKEKYIEKGTDSTPSATTLLKQTYTFEKPILVKAENGPSIAAMAALTGGDGVFEHAIIDSKIRSTSQAFEYANGYLNIYANAIVTLEFTTNVMGLEIGQTLSYTSSLYGYTAESFLIQRIEKTLFEREAWTYRVTCASSLYGMEDLLNYLLDKDLQIDAGQTVGIIQTDSETYTMTESSSLTTDSNLVYKWGADAHPLVWNFSQWS